MRSTSHGFRIIDDLRWRSWDGAVVDVWNVACDPGAHGEYLAPDPRLFMVLDINPGGRLDLAISDPAIHASLDHLGAMAYIPAGTTLQLRADGIDRLRHMDVHFAEADLTRKFGKALDLSRVGAIRLPAEDARLATIARLLAEECCAQDHLDSHFGAGLIDALTTVMFDVADKTNEQKRPGLSRSQLQKSTEYIEANCFQSIRLRDIASLLGLSETYFSHAFKASTGVPPLRWQMEARIDGVKKLLTKEKLSLTEIAASTGFSDQAHLTRTFKRVVGIAPSVWRRNIGT